MQAAAAAGRHCLGCREGGSHKQLALHHNLWVALDGGPPAAPYGRTANYYYAAEFRVWKGRKQVKKKKRQFQRWGEQQKGRRWYTPFDVLPRRRSREKTRGFRQAHHHHHQVVRRGERDAVGAAAATLHLIYRRLHLGSLLLLGFFFIIIYIYTFGAFTHSLPPSSFTPPAITDWIVCVCVLYSSFFLFGIFSHNAAFCLSMLDTI